MRVLSLALVLTMTLAGCAGDPALSEDEQLQEAVEIGIASDVPVWSTGQYWTYKMTAGEFEIGTSSLIVVGDAGGDYLVGTNDKGVAYFDARFDITFMGEVRKSDLAGSQNGDRVAMFDWPLAAEKEWTTTWDGEALRMFANPMGPGEFHVMGHRQSDGAMAVEYHYNPEVAWFEYIVFYDADNGTEAFRMSLEDSGDQFTGTVYEYELLEAIVYNTTEMAFTQAEFGISDDVSELGITGRLHCGQQGNILAGLQAPDEQGNAQQMPPAPQLREPDWGMNYACPGGGDQFDVAVLGAVTGTWRYDAAALSQGGWIHVSIEPRIVTETVF